MICFPRPPDYANSLELNKKRKRKKNNATRFLKLNLEY